MSYISTHLRPVLARPSRAGLLLALASAALFLMATSCLQAQFGVPQGGTQVHDPSALKPPAGARVAMVEFEDMECPDCARANPLLKEAAAKYKIPWVRHDFPLPMHNWSFQAAVNARWFDTKSKSPRRRVPRLRSSPTSPPSSAPNRCASSPRSSPPSHGIALPFAIDPQGKLADLVKADYALGQRIGIEHTPTIWVVTANSKGAPFVEVVDRTKLFQIIDQALVDTASAPKTVPAKPAPVKKSPANK